MQLEHVKGLIELYSYFVLFPLVLVEGPIVTVIAGFLAHLRVINFFIAYVVIVIADVVADIGWYSIGRFARGTVERLGRFVGITSKKLSKVDMHFESHGRKTIMIGKLVLGLEVAVLVGAGMAKYNFRKYALYTLLPTLPKSLFFMLVGYFFGGAFSTINAYLKNGVISILLVAFAFLFFYFVVYRLALKRISTIFR